MVLSAIQYHNDNPLHVNLPLKALILLLISPANATKSQELSLFFND